MKTSKLIFVCIVSMLLGCAPKPAIRVDLDTYLQHTGQYSGKNIIITASIEDILQRYELYTNKEVEVAGTVSYYGSNHFWTWHILLAKNGKTVRCYAHQYRVEPGRDALHMVRWAQSEKDEITVQGKVKKDGIEILYLKYGGDIVTPYYKPTDHYNTRWDLLFNTVPSTDEMQKTYREEPSYSESVKNCTHQGRES